MSDKIGTATRLAVLKHLVKGKSPEVVGVAVGISRFEVIDIASNHGYPDVEKMTRAIDIITKRAETEAPTEVPQVRRPAPAPVARPTAAPAPAPTPAPVPAAAVAPDELEAVDGSPAGVLAEAEESSNKRVRNLASKIRTDLERLQDLLEQDREREKAVREAAKAKAELQEKKAQLERELAEVKAKLRGPNARTTAAASSPAEPTAKQVRTWAQEAGVDCPSTGRVPQAVREAYDAAHKSAAA